MGALLLLVGVALLTGAFTDFSYWMLETYEVWHCRSDGLRHFRSLISG
jgi:hypothetical protein